MHKFLNFIRQFFHAWTSALSSAGTQGVFSAVHHLILFVLSGLALVHVVFTIYFLAIDIEAMVAVNVGIVIYYLALSWYQLNNNKYHDLFIFLIVLEVCFHAVLSSYYIGWHSGFSIYLMAITVIIAVISSSSIYNRIAVILFLTTMLVGSDFYFSNHTPVYQLDQSILDTTRMVNYANALLQLAMAAMGYQYLLAVANAKMDKLANEDQLTGLLNRRAMQTRSQEVIARCRATRIPMCVAIGDLDHFKRINDSCGHAAGDEVLVAVSKKINETRRSGDVSARWGGEEFVWLLANCTPRQAEKALNRLRKQVQNLAPISEDSEWRVTISLGVTQILPSESFSQAIDRADLALYRAKHNGRNIVEFEPIDIGAPISPRKMQQTT